MKRNMLRHIQRTKSSYFNGSKHKYSQIDKEQPYAGPILYEKKFFCIVFWPTRFIETGKGHLEIGMTLTHQNLQRVFELKLDIYRHWQIPLVRNDALETNST